MLSPGDSKVKKRLFLSLSLCQAVRGRRGGRQVYMLENGGTAASALQHLLLGLAVHGPGGVGVGRPAHPSLLKDAQTPGSSPWLCLPLLGTLCPSQPD